jgi:hypothetical protein
MLDPNAPAPATADELFRTMYQDLRRLASSRLHHRPHRAARLAEGRCC